MMTPDLDSSNPSNWPEETTETVPTNAVTVVEMDNVPTNATTEVTTMPLDERKVTKYNPPDLAEQRRMKWRGAIEQELQSLVREASTLRININTAKTRTKKEYYNKKFKKITTQVMQMVAALERLKQPSAPHIHDEHCNHEPKIISDTTNEIQETTTSPAP